MAQPTSDNDYPWMLEARKHVGLREIKGARHEPRISTWLRNLSAWWQDDETAWCGTFVAHCLVAAGLPKPKKWYRAMEYARYGRPLVIPRYGCIAVFSRQGGGHVGFVAGMDQNGRLMVLGGNQGDQVSIAPFDRRRVVSYRSPTEEELTLDMPTLASTAKSSNNEA